MAPLRRLAAAVAAATVLTACSAGGGGGGGGGEAVRPTTPTTGAATASTTAPTTSTTSAAEAVAAGECPQVPPPAGPDPERPSYVIEVAVDPSAGVVDGTVQVRFTPDVGTDRLVFRLWPNAPRPAAAGVSIEAGPVTSTDGTPLTVSQPDPTTLVAMLPAPLPAGSPVEVGVPFRLEIPGPAPDRLSREGDSLRLGSFFPILAWEPGVGWAMEPPTAGYAEASTAPTADFEVTATVPDGWTVLGTGRAGEDGTWRAEAVRDVALAVGRFTTVTATAEAPEPVTVTVGVAPGADDRPEDYAEAAVEALEDFSARFGAYPWPELTVSVTPGLPGAIEYPATILHGTGTATHVAHEVGHQWFYGLVGNDQGRDPWLDEGLATWAQTRVGMPPLDQLPRPVPGDAVGRAGEPMTFWEQRLGSYYRGVYVQPALALAELGDPEMVDCALRHYVAETAYGVAVPEDLFDALRTIFPDAEEVLAPAGLSP